MYSKLFDSMYDGTLREHWEALVTMQQLIILADQHGIVDMTPQAISSRTNIPIEIIEKGIGLLEAPDPNSRTPDCQGRRIERMDDHRAWGWILVNHDKYRSMRDPAEEREKTRLRVAKFREKRAKEALNQGLVTDVTPGNAEKRYTDTDTEKKDIAHFSDFWAAYPRKVAKPQAERAWRRLKPADQQAILAALPEWPFSDDKKFQPHPATWLNARRWEDDPGDTRINGHDNPFARFVP